MKGLDGTGCSAEDSWRGTDIAVKCENGIDQQTSVKEGLTSRWE